MSLSGAERAPLDAFLARLLLEELSASLLEVLRRESICDILDRASAGCGAWLRKPWTPPREEQAREEFARLFLVPHGAPPFASAWIEGPGERVGAQLATIVSRALTSLGRELRPGQPWGRLSLDHLGLILDLCAEGYLGDHPNGVQVADHLNTQLLGPWVGEFGRTLARRAKLPVYRAAGELLTQLFGAPRAPLCATSCSPS